MRVFSKRRPCVRCRGARRARRDYHGPRSRIRVEPNGIAIGPARPFLTRVKAVAQGRVHHGGRPARSEPMDDRPWLRFYGDVPATLDYPDAALHEVLRATARRTPGATALEYFG